MIVPWVVVAPPARAATVAPKMPYAYWIKADGGEAVEVRSTYNIRHDPVSQPWQKPPNVYWANQFYPVVPDRGGYFGLQKRAATPHKAALFAWWETLDVACPDVPILVHCGAFGHEGSGYSIGVGFDWQEDADYTFRMWRGDHDAARDAYWWSVEILDGAGAHLVPMGSILVPSRYGGIAGMVQWSEWFAIGSEAADHCDQVPATDTWFGAPLLDGVPATPTGTGVTDDAACPAEAVWAAGGSRQRFGTSTPATTTTTAVPTSTTTTTTTVPDLVGVQSALSSWAQPGSVPLDGIGGWIAAVNEPVTAAGGLPPSYLYAHGFGFTGSAATGFVGLVTSPSGKYAVLSVTAPDGTADHAVVALEWKAGHFYFPLVHQLSPGVWGAWVYDHSAGVWIHVGVLSLPAAWGRLSPASITALAWVGPPTAPSCSAFPLADVFFHHPTGFSGGRATEGGLGTHATTSGACPAQTSLEAGTWARYRVGTEH